MTNKPTILIVDDEPRIGRFIGTNLRATGFEVELALTGAEALETLSRCDPDLILLDLGLPDMDGLDLFKRLRQFTETPVVILTARGSSADKVRGLDLGADDYMVKPFDVDELLARVRAVLRRSPKSPGSRAAKAQVVLGPLSVDAPRHEVHVHGEAVHLTPTEFKLLAYLAANAEKVVFHEDLLSHVWGSEYRDSVEYLRVTVLRIRQKLGDAPDVRQLIQSVPGVGYKLIRP